MKKRFFLFCTCCLSAIILRVDSFTQTELQSSEQSSAGGRIQEGNVDLTAILGQPSPVGLAPGENDPVFSGFIYAIENRLADIVHDEILRGDKSAEIVIAANITDDQGIRKATLNYRIGGSSEFTETDMTEKNGSFQGTIPVDAITARGLEYFFIAIDSLGLSARFPDKGTIAVRVDISEPGIVKSTPQPGGRVQSNYRLISVPLDVNDKSPAAVLADDLGKYNTRVWRFFEYGAGQNFIEFPRTTQMDPGKSFFLIVKGTGIVLDTGVGTTNPTNEPFEIKLHPKWNFIANPFNFSALAEPVLSNGEPFRLLLFNGRYSDLLDPENTLLQPFDGFGVYNFSDTTVSMLINPNRSALAKAVGNSVDKAIWSIRITAECQGTWDSNNILATHPEASREWDRHDYPEPPPIGEFVSVYFPHTDWQARRTIYTTDYRPKIEDGDVWEFAVRTNIRDVVSLKFDGVEDIPEEYEVLLLDGTTKNLREIKNYTIAKRVSDQPKFLKIVVGKRNYINENLEGIQIIPTSFELAQNFPNPFNPSTTIRYGLPKEAKVTVTVYNLLGKTVVTLVDDETKKAGSHIVTWNGSNASGRQVASGVFVYQLRSGNLRMTKKLILMK